MRRNATVDDYVRASVRHKLPNLNPIGHKWLNRLTYWETTEADPILSDAIVTDLLQNRPDFLTNNKEA